MRFNEVDDKLHSISPKLAVVAVWKSGIQFVGDFIGHSSERRTDYQTEFIYIELCGITQDMIKNNEFSAVPREHGCWWLLPSLLIM